MKVTMHCYICLLERAIKFAQMLGKPQEKVLEVAKEVSKLLINEFTLNANPAVLGTKREWLVSRILGEEDPYRDLKARSNKIGFEVAKEVFSRIDMDDYSYSTFRRVMIYSAAANAMEWLIRGHEFFLEKFFVEMDKALSNIAIDDTHNLYKLVKGNTILYALDNVGEAAVDLFVVEYLKNIARKVIVAAKTSPVLNDITVDEAKSLGFEKVADKIVGVSKYVGFYLEEATEEFRSALRESNVIIAKGMGAYETLTEYDLDIPTFVALKAKCIPVAKSLGVEQGRLVIKRLF